MGKGLRWMSSQALSKQTITGPWPACVIQPSTSFEGASGMGHVTATEGADQERLCRNKESCQSVPSQSAVMTTTMHL